MIVTISAKRRAAAAAAELINIRDRSWDNCVTRDLSRILISSVAAAAARRLAEIVTIISEVERT